MLVAVRDASVGASSSVPDPVSSSELRLEADRLESEFRYDEAIAVVDVLLERAPADATALRRLRSTLEAFLNLAQESYARADAAADPAEEAFHLALIQSFWPGYRDVGERLLALRAAKPQGGS